jgi:hypothetical protein
MATQIGWILSQLGFQDHPGIQLGRSDTISKQGFKEPDDVAKVVGLAAALASRLRFDGGLRVTCDRTMRMRLALALSNSKRQTSASALRRHCPRSSPSVLIPTR